MPRYRFAVEYQGSRYAGWQRQPGERTVQGDLEAALRVALHLPPETGLNVVGSGRTDAGVHARGQVAHVDTQEAVDAGRLQRSLNALCRGDLAVRALEACEPTFHARYSALARRYVYRLAQRPTPLMAQTSWLVGPRVRAGALLSELAGAVGVHDFVAFCVPRRDGKSTLCHVMKTEITEEQAFLCVHIEANRFLHRMVRSLVGAAVDVARGEKPPGLIARTLAGMTGEAAEKWTWAPPSGLCLEKVSYADYDPGP